MIESYLDYTSETPSPEIFRLWAGISLIAGVLERKVYVKLSGGEIYPALYVLLVATPGVGKTQAIVPVKKLWKEIKELHVSPDNMTKAALVDTIAAAKRAIVKSPTDLLDFSMLNIPADELGVFITKYDDEFLSVMNKLFDAPDSFVESRRAFKGENISIAKPLVNMIAGTQPAFLGSVFPDHAWHSGFASRLLMIYSTQGMRRSLFNGHDLDKGLRDRLLLDLRATFQLWGRMKFTEEAIHLIEQWHNIGQDTTAPNHSKLRDYVPRRVLFLVKLCMISSVSRGTSLEISKFDFHRALTWLLAAEKVMPDVFRAIQQKSDIELISDLHRYLWSIYSKNKVPIPEHVLIRFLSSQVPAERVKPIIEMAERMKYVHRPEGTNLYIPTALDKLHLE